MNELREFLTETPLLDGQPLFRSVREAAALISNLPDATKFAGKPDSANSALNAIMRGERPFTPEVQHVLIQALKMRVADPAARSEITRRLKLIPLAGRRGIKASGESSAFTAIIDAYRDATDALMVRPVPQPGVSVETHPMRYLLFKKLGMCRSADVHGKTSSGAQNFATARLTFVLGSYEHALRGFESFFLQAVGAASGHPMGEDESLDIEEAIARLKAIEEGDLLRIFVVEPELCLTPVHIVNPSSESLAHGWIVYYLPGNRTQTLSIPPDYLRHFQEGFGRKLESGSLPGQRQVRWSDVDQDRVIAQAASLKLVQGH